MNKANASPILLIDEIVDDILLRLPVKSLKRFKLVSKPWNSLISDPKFAVSYLQDKPLRVGQIYAKGGPKPSLSLYSMDADGSNREILTVDYDYDHDDYYDNPYDSNSDVQILGSCNGLLFLLVGTSKYLLWNPITREYKYIALDSSHRNEERGMKISALGYDSSSGNYKGITVSHYISGISSPHDEDVLYEEVRCYVYDYKKDSWTDKKQYIYNEFPYTLHSCNSAIMVNGVPHWCVYRRHGRHREGYDRLQIRVSYVIVYFDLETEKFKEVGLPGWAAEEVKFYLGVLGGCLCMCLDPQKNSSSFEVWTMKEYRIVESWTKLFVISSPFFKELRPLCYTDTGKNQVLMEVEEKNKAGRKLIIFNLGEKTQKTLLVDKNFESTIGGILCQSGDLGRALYHMNSEGLSRKVVMIDHDDFARCIDLAGILGTCNGLFLVLIITRQSKNCILWNPSSRKCMTIAPYHVPSDMALVISGLGYESSSRNYQGVVVYSHYNPWTSQDAYGNKEFLCLVYNYKINSWTRKYESDYDLFDFSHSWDVAMVNGVPHWCVFRIDQLNFSKTYLIVYFDLENENFKVLVGVPEWGIEEMKFHLGVLGGLGYESTSGNYKGIIVSHYISGPSSPHHADGQYEAIDYKVYDNKLNEWKWKEYGDFYPYRVHSGGSGSAVMVNGIPHWCVYRREEAADGQNDGEGYGSIFFRVTYVIVYVDLITEKLKEVELPVWALNEEIEFDLGVLGGCLCMSLHPQGSSTGFEVWAMKEIFEACKDRHLWAMATLVSRTLYRTLPVRDEILRALLNCDLIGFQFHTFDYARHFLSSSRRVLGLHSESIRGHIAIDYYGRNVTIKILPAGIHMEQLQPVMSEETTVRKAKELKQEYEGKFLMVGVNDLDLFKGIPQKLLAMEKLLEFNPELRAKYAVADCCVVTPVRDGMNLVPYKYTVCRQGCPVLDKALGLPMIYCKLIY
ncbi:hypothetical protein CCACVL1_27417 [Corchorus capsularis]|uniref:F-box domain-containing protein n=1 Tax=Corchorus capsularis TaxID=210143 RepID=A0A1R3GAD9_COCAP|nr:hypothetical protein CCACVL1_27417 [Corchorus capsularis]